MQKVRKLLLEEYVCFNVSQEFVFWTWYYLGTAKGVTSSSKHKIDGLVQDCSNNSGLAMELLQSCTKPSKWICHDLGWSCAYIGFIMYLYCLVFTLQRSGWHCPLFSLEAGCLLVLRVFVLGLWHRLHTSQVSDVFALHRCVAVYLLIDTRLYCLHG